MLGGLGNIVDMMKSAKDIQARMATYQEEVANMRFDAETGGGAVRVTVDGKFRMIDIKIEPSALEDGELLEDLIKSATNAAGVRVKETLKEKLTEVTGGLNIPGLENMLPG
ncbi:MAG: YbaB/EbfC family nucleoid-associated protein [Planctomycetes bacterium]|nr:YbaB/EbfC family nucleoid-associated protein [Planctomycetota bacterium]